MKTSTLNQERTLGVDLKAGRRHILRATSSWWKDFRRQVIARLAAPFRSDWDTKGGSPWREWGKL